MATNPHPATASEILEITGALDGAVLSAVLAVGATQAEVIDAFIRVRTDEALDPAIGPTLDTAARRVFAILSDALAPPEEA